MRARYHLDHGIDTSDPEVNEILLRAFLLERYTSKQLDDEMSAPDMELLISLWDLLQVRRQNSINSLLGV